MATRSRPRQPRRHGERRGERAGKGAWVGILWQNLIMLRLGSNYNRMMHAIYLDHNATTPLLPEAWEAMRPLAAENFGNPSSAHAAGRRARQALEDAREKIAALLGAFPDEVTF